MFEKNNNVYKCLSLNLINTQKIRRLNMSEDLVNDMDKQQNIHGIQIKES